MKTTIVCTFIALLSQSVFADERGTVEPKIVEIPQDSLHELSFNWHFGLDHNANPNVIDLATVPRIVQFERFIDGSSPTPNVLGSSPFTTSVSVFDGQPVVLGGMRREEWQKVEDKLGELIKERNQLKSRLTELEALIQGLSKP